MFVKIECILYELDQRELFNPDFLILHTNPEVRGSVPEGPHVWTAAGRTLMDRLHGIPDVFSTHCYGRKDLGMELGVLVEIGENYEETLRAIIETFRTLPSQAATPV